MDLHIRVLHNPMGLKFVCDGCTADAEQSTLTKVGCLEPAYYCPHCLPAWRIFEANERAERVKIVKGFEAWREARLADLRQTLKKVPDE